MILLHDTKECHQNNELKTLSQQIKTSITKDGTLTLPNTNHPFLINLDFSSIGIGFFLFQYINKGKFDVVAKNLVILQLMHKTSALLIVN